MSSVIKSIFSSSTAKFGDKKGNEDRPKKGKEVSFKLSNKKRLSAIISSKLKFRKLKLNKTTSEERKQSATEFQPAGESKGQPATLSSEDRELGIHLDARLGQKVDHSEHQEQDQDQEEFFDANNYFTSKDMAPPSEWFKLSQGSSSFAGCSAKDKKCDLLPEEQCDIPTFLHTPNCDAHLIEETRRLLRERYEKNAENFYDHDYQRMLADDWTVSRFLLRRRLDPKRSAKLMEECAKFRRQFRMSEVELWEFPIEFHKAGGLFQYAPDRVGNETLYMRVKMYRRVPEISDVFKEFILCVLEQCDAANGGRGTAVIFDLSGCGYQNVDLSFLSWLLSSFRNFCPKGVSYIVVYNLPWILNATCKLAMSWMSASNRRALRLVHGKEIENFIAPENLPDYLGGTCKLNYRRVPEGSLPSTEVCERLDMTPQQALKIRELFAEYLDEEDENQPEKQPKGGKN